MDTSTCIWDIFLVVPATLLCIPLRSKALFAPQQKIDFDLIFRFWNPSRTWDMQKFLWNQKPQLKDLGPTYMEVGDPR